MDRETLYKFFEGAASYEEEVRIRQWMEHSPENRRKFLKERKIFDSMLLLGDEKTSLFNLFCISFRIYLKFDRMLIYNDLLFLPMIVMIDK